MIRHIRKIVAMVALVVAAATGLGIATVSPAGATVNIGIGVPCGFTHPTAPNAVDYCLGWIHDPVSTWSYRIEASHHVGWWGGNYDPGTWHVFVDRFVHTTGAWQEREVDMNFGDQNVPYTYNNGSGVGAYLVLYPGGPFRNVDGSAASYMSCGPWFGDSYSTFISRLNNGAWPYGYTGTARNGTACQNGSGFVASNTWIDNNTTYLYGGVVFNAGRILLP